MVGYVDIWSCLRLVDLCMLSLGALMISSATYHHMQGVDLVITNFRYFVSMLTCIKVNAYE